MDAGILLGIFIGTLVVSMGTGALYRWWEDHQVDRIVDMCKKTDCSCREKEENETH